MTIRLEEFQLGLQHFDKGKVTSSNNDVICSLYNTCSSFQQLKPFLRRYETTYGRKRLLLGTQSDLPCVAVEFMEYFSYDEKDNLKLFTVYLGKLDSTGLIEPRVMQSVLLTNILRGAIRFYTDLSKYLKVELRLHIYARSNPEYLFQGSSSLKSKHAVPGRQLVYWWRRMLEQAFNDDTDNWKKYWVIPGVEASMIPREQRGEGWEYAYPFANEIAVETIPKFEDDSKSKCLYRSFENDDSLTVSDFISDVLSNSPDFVEGQAGLFVLKFTPTDLESTHRSSDLPESGDGPFEEIENLLSDLVFDTVDNAKDSLKNIASRFEETDAISILCELPKQEPKRQQEPVQQINVLTVKRRKKE